MQINLAFKFHREAALNQMVLVDKINRAKPKVQSALLEAMEKILLLKSQHRHSLIESLPIKLPPAQMLEMQHAFTGIYVSSAVLDYCPAIFNFTRE